MKQVLPMVAAAAILVFSANAFADEASGKVKSVDTEAGTVELEDGTSYRVGDGVSLDNITPGSDVNVSYEEADGERTATEITPSE